MRWNGLRWLAGCWLALVHFPDPALAADGPRDDRMAAIVAAVRAEEAKFKDIEYVVRIVVRDTSPKGPNRADDVKTMATRHAIYQGDWTYFRLQAFERGSDTKFRREEISAYDGERTAHGRRRQFRQHPPGPLAASGPLSRAQPAAGPRRRRLPTLGLPGRDRGGPAHTAYVGEIAQFGVLDAYSEVAARFESEDVVDGLRCLTVRVDRAYSRQRAGPARTLAGPRAELSLHQGSPLLARRATRRPAVPRDAGGGAARGGPRRLVPHEDRGR